MLWAYDCPGIKGEHMKLNPFIKEATGSGEADRRAGEGGRPAHRTEVSPFLMPWHARKDSWAAGLSKWLILTHRGPRPAWLLYPVLSLSAADWYGGRTLCNCKIFSFNKRQHWPCFSAKWSNLKFMIRPHMELSCRAFSSWCRSQHVDAWCEMNGCYFSSHISCSELNKWWEVIGFCSRAGRLPHHRCRGRAEDGEESRKPRWWGRCRQTVKCLGRSRESWFK